MAGALYPGMNVLRVTTVSSFTSALGDQHAVERIPVDVGKRLDGVRMVHRDRELGQILARDHLLEVPERTSSPAPSVEVRYHQAWPSSASSMTFSDPSCAGLRVRTRLGPTASA